MPHNDGFVGLFLVGSSHPLLEIHGALYGVDGAPELNEHPIPSGLEHTTLMLGDQRFNYFLEPRLEQG